MKKDDPRFGLRSAYIPHERVFADVGGPSLTRQEFAEECDINVLMARFESTGVGPQTVTGEPRYLDLTDVPDLQHAMHVMIEADNAFMTLPAKVRKEFDNDPVKFVEFASDPENLPQMRDWGLAPPEKAPEAPLRVEVVTPAGQDGPPKAGPGAGQA